MSLSISDLKGVDKGIADKLKSAGLSNSDKLLAAMAEPQDRKTWAAQLEIPERTLLELANRADLARVDGIGAAYSDLLEFAGVDTIAELATRNPDNLLQKLIDVAAEHGIGRLPTQAEVYDWVAQAKELGRGIYY